MITETPNYYLPVTMQSGTARYEDIPCKVYLPVRFTEPVVLHLYPDEEQYQGLTLFYAVWTVSGSLAGGASKVELSATKAHVTQPSGIGSGLARRELSIDVEPV